MPYRKSLRKKPKAKISWVKLTILTLVFLVGLLLIGQILLTLRNAVWDGQSRINLVVKAQNIYLLSFSPEEEKLVIILASDDLSVEAPHGFGFYRFGAIYNLGEIDKAGGNLLMETAQEFFAAPVHGFIKTQPEKLKISDEKSAKDKISFFFQEEIWPPKNEGGTKSNLTFWDKVRLFWQIRKVRFDKVVFLNLKEEGIVKEDGGINFVKLDELLLPLLAEEKVRQEGLKVEILNSTGKAGLGERIRRLVANSGGEVVSVGNQEEELEHCLIKVKKENLKKKTVRILKKTLSCRLEENELLESRADLILVVGRDFWERLTR